MRIPVKTDRFFPKQPIDTIHKINKIRKRRKFLEAVVEGKKVTDIRKEVHLAESLKHIVNNTPSGLALQRELLQVQEFTDPGIRDKLKEFWEAKKRTPLVTGPKNNQEIVWTETPDRETQRYAMDRLLELRGLRRRQAEETDPEGNKLPVAMNFIEVNHFNTNGETKKEKTVIETTAKEE